MKIKGWIVISLAVVLTVAAITGCGKKSTSGGNDKAGGNSAVVETEANTTAAAANTTAAAATEKAGAADEGTKADTAVKENAEESGSQESGALKSDAGAGEQLEEEEEAGPGAAAGESEIAAVEAFAERIQEAVADKDMETFAGLIDFPVAFVTADGEEMVISDREEFLKQNPDMIFGDDLMVAVATVDTAALTVEDGCVTMGEEGQPLIRYEELGVGKYAITAIRE